MKKILKFLLLTLLIFSTTTKAFALLAEDDEKRRKYIKVTGFSNYPPFGQSKGMSANVKFKSMFDGFLKEFSNDNHFEFEYIIHPENYKNDVSEVRSGIIHLIVGIYNNSAMYEGIEYIYPSAINNPIHIITLPSKAGTISSVDDLSKLKGAMHSSEHLSDFVATKVKDMGVERISSSYEMYEKLFKGEIDYILSSRYFAMIETINLGIKNKVSFSKKAVWDMPLFFGVAKSYEYRRLLNDYIGGKLKKPEIKEKINNYLIEMINNMERENAGVVPPTFTTE